MLVAATARAQFAQYIPPGSLGLQELPTKERLEAAMEGAQFRLGPVRLATWFALENVNWVNNVYGTATDQKSDFTGTVSMGLHGYIPSGGKLVFAFYALPEYVWWRDLAYLRSWNGRYGVGLFGYFSRVTVELQAGDWRTQEFYSSEDQIPVNVKDRHASATVDVRLLGNLSVFGTARGERWRYEDQSADLAVGGAFSISDRNEQRVGGGLRYRFSERVSIGLGYEQFTTDFQHEVGDRSNSGGGPHFEIEARGKHLWASGSADSLSLEGRDGSEFGRLERTAGQLQIGWKPGAKLEWQAYGGRTISYTLVDLNPYYVDERWGVGVQSPFGWRGTGRVFWEKGQDEYPPVAGGIARTDDFKSYGLAVEFKLWRKSAFALGGSRTDYTSTLPGYERSITRFQATVRLSGGGNRWW
jgi:opacity protein-like surface antigen